MNVVVLYQLDASCDLGNTSDKSIVSFVRLLMHKAIYKGEGRIELFLVFVLLKKLQHKNIFKQPLRS